MVQGKLDESHVGITGTVRYEKVILFCFAGRKSVMSLQVQYMLYLLELDFVEAYHVWDLAWESEDRDYLRTLALLHPKIQIMHTPFPPGTRASTTAAQQFAFIYSSFYQHQVYHNHILVKIDDDIVFVDVLAFESFIEYRKQSTAFLLSANVFNNNVTIAHKVFGSEHEAFLNNIKDTLKTYMHYPVEDYGNTKVLSINFVSFLGEDLHYINAEFANGYGNEDERRIAMQLPQILHRSNEIFSSLVVFHYQYGGIINGLIR
jgi:hypothetical protein